MGCHRLLPIPDIHQQISTFPIMHKTMSKLIILFAFAACLVSCKTTQQTQSSESGSNAVSQAQWRYSHNFSSDSIWRLTALSFDSCVFTFGGTDTSKAPQCSASAYPSGKPKGTPQANNKAKASSIPKATPSANAKSSPLIFPHGKPSSVKLYGLHLSQKVEEKSSMYQSEADCLAKAMQSSYDKSQSSTKSRTSTYFLFIVICIFIIPVGGINSSCTVEV